jgi:hypothetical protein
MNPSLRLAAGLLLAGLCLPTLQAQAQERGRNVPRPSPNATIGQTIGVTDVTITYGRPLVKGRTIFGELEKYGTVWRAGANEATTITFTDAVQIEGQPLAAGTYGFFTIPGEAEWTVIFNREPKQWGAYEYDAAKDALRVTVRPETGAPTEMLAYSFEDVTEDGAKVVLAWDRVRVPFRVAVDTDALTLAKARAAAASPQDWRATMEYVYYALESKQHLEEALGWADKSIALQETLGNLQAKAHLLAALDRYDEAVVAGEKALAKGKAMERNPGLDTFLAEFEGTIGEWKKK